MRAVDRREEVHGHQQDDRQQEQRVAEPAKHAVVERRHQQHDRQGDRRVGHLLVQKPPAAFRQLLDPRDSEPAQADQQKRGGNNRPGQSSDPGSGFHRYFLA